MKQIDELDLKRERDAQFTSDTYNSRFKGEFFLPSDTEKKNPMDKAKLRWSYFKQMKTDEMLPHVQQWVFPFIKELNGDGSAFTRHMANAVFLIPSANLLQGAIAIIEDIFVEIDVRRARKASSSRTFRATYMNYCSMKSVVLERMGNFVRPAILSSSLANL